MRDPVVALYVLSVVVVAATVASVSQTRGARSALVAFLLQAAIGALAVLAFPLYLARQAGPSAWVFVACAVGLLLAVVPLGVSPSRPLERFAGVVARRPVFANVTLAVTSTVLLLAALEFTAATLTRAGLARRYTPTETRLAQQTEDWRLAHIMSDDFREPDPVLLWRPVARAPYTAQRFRGPTVDPRKPSHTVRVICYGDSNTDGPRQGGAWPAALADALSAQPQAEREHLAYEVLNAGVTGYSSYQGLRRLEQEIEVYHPDVVLVSFGWNDAATSIASQDKAFASSPAFRAVNPWAVALRRLLFKYDAMLVAARFVSPSRTLEEATAADHGPRVSLDDYAGNLTAMVARARAAGARPILMTRPHRESEEALAVSPGWRRRVPAYNAVVRQVGSTEAVAVVDVQREFAGRVALFADESHFTPEGHRLLALTVLARLREAGVVEHAGPD